MKRKIYHVINLRRILPEGFLNFNGQADVAAGRDKYKAGAGIPETNPLILTSKRGKEIESNIYSN